MNLSRVDFLDSAGLGELARAHTSVRNYGGQLKFVNPSKKVHDLLRVTKMDRVLEIEPDESSAFNSFKDEAASAKVGG